jgi:hypothetical protein
VPESFVILLPQSAVLVEQCFSFVSLHVVSVMFCWFVGWQMLLVAPAAGSWHLLLTVMVQCLFALQKWEA